MSRVRVNLLLELFAILALAIAVGVIVAGPSRGTEGGRHVAVD